MKSGVGNGQRPKYQVGGHLSVATCSESDVVVVETEVEVEVAFEVEVAVVGGLDFFICDEIVVVVPATDLGPLELHPAAPIATIARAIAPTERAFQPSTPVEKKWWPRIICPCPQRCSFPPFSELATLVPSRRRCLGECFKRRPFICTASRRLSRGESTNPIWRSTCHGVQPSPGRRPHAPPGNIWCVLAFPSCQRSLHNSRTNSVRWYVLSQRTPQYACA